MAWRTDIPKEELLGAGLYVASEAAMYIHVRPQQLMRWLHGSRQGAPVLEAQFPGHREVVSFLDMVQAMAIRDMRTKKGIPLGRIRDSLRWLRKHHPEIKYPFARPHQTYILEATKQIAIRLPGHDPEYPLEVSGKHKGQYVHARMLDKYLQELKFGPDNLANQYIPIADQGRRVVLDPEVRFGQPRVEPAGYLVQTLVEAYQAEGKVDAAAWWYQVAPPDVEIALRYHESLLEQPHAKAS